MPNGLTRQARRGRVISGPGTAPPYTRSPMRIVLVNWAKIWDGASYGGGVNGYCQALALELVRYGHDVISLCGGTTFVPGSPQEGSDQPGPCQVRRLDDWLGVRVFEVINSPVLAPSLLQFADPGTETQCPELAQALGEFFALLQPQVVHFHNIEGFSTDCVEAAQSARGDWPGATVLFTLHNYHTLCPQVYLMQGHRIPCHDSQNGLACSGCIQAADPNEERRRRARQYVEVHRPEPIEQTPEPKRASLLSHMIVEIKSAIGIGDQRHEETASQEASTPLPGHQIVDEASVSRSLPEPLQDIRGKTAQLQEELHRGFKALPESSQWQPLLNVVEPEPTSQNPPNAYAKRRQAMIAMLNKCDRVLAVSDFVRRKFESMGVEPRRLITSPIGSRINEVVARHQELIFDPPPFDSVHPRPIRLVFMGYNNHYKGLGMLADALELLTPDYLRQFELSIYALEGQEIEWRFRRLEPRLAGLTVHHGYEYHDIPWMLGGKDLGLVTSVWWHNAPQTVFEYFACGVPVLAANLGGIPDFVLDGHNGLLFRGNDRYDLAKRLAEVARDPGGLQRLRDAVRPPLGIKEHAAALAEMYKHSLASRGPTVTQPGTARRNLHLRDTAAAGQS